MAEKAKKSIINGLFSLLKTRDLDSISIVDIVKESNVCRATFYRNFSSINDIFDYYLRGIIKTIHKNHPISRNNIRTITYHGFNEIKKNKENLLLLKRHQRLHIFGPLLYEAILEQVIKLNLKYNSYRLNYYAGAVFGFVREWMNNDFKESTEEITEIFFNITFRSV